MKSFNARKIRVILAFLVPIAACFLVLSEFGSQSFNLNSSWMTRRKLASSSDRAVMGSESLVGDLKDTSFQELARIHVIVESDSPIPFEQSVLRFIISNEGLLCPQKLETNEMSAFEFLSFSVKNSGCLDLRNASEGRVITSKVLTDAHNNSLQDSLSLTFKPLKIDRFSNSKLSSIEGLVSFSMLWQDSSLWHESEASLPLRVERFPSGYWKLLLVTPHQLTPSQQVREFDLRIKTRQSTRQVDSSGIDVVKIPIEILPH